MVDASTCDECGAALVAGARFCRACGAAVDAAPAEPPAYASDPGCPACTADLVPGARFCRSCGHDLQGVASHAAAPQRETHVVNTPPDRALQAAPLPPPERRTAVMYDAEPPVGGRQGRRRGLFVVLAVVGALAVLGGGAVAGMTLLGSDDEPAARADDGQASTDDGGESSSGDGPEVEVTKTTAGPEVNTEKAPAPTVLPSGSKDQFDDDITSLLLEFHRDIVSSDYRAAWDLLSERKRKQITREDGYDAWEEAQSSLTPWLDPEGLEVVVKEVNRITGVARVALSGMGWSARNADCTEWSGVTWVKYEDGSWHYDPGYSTTPQRERDWKSRFGELLGGSC